MPKFKVAHNYRSNHNGRHFAYDEGATVDVDAGVAAWVNRDSPGTLVAASDSRREADKPADRQKRTGRNRSQS